MPFTSALVFELVETCYLMLTMKSVSVGNTVKNTCIMSQGQPPNLSKDVVKCGNELLSIKGLACIQKYPILLHT